MTDSLKFSKWKGIDINSVWYYKILQDAANYKLKNDKIFLSEIYLISRVFISIATSRETASYVY